MAQEDNSKMVDPFDMETPLHFIATPEEYAEKLLIFKKSLKQYEETRKNGCPGEPENPETGCYFQDEVNRLKMMKLLLKKAQRDLLIEESEEDIELMITPIMLPCVPEKLLKAFIQSGNNMSLNQEQAVEWLGLFPDDLARIIKRDGGINLAKLLGVETGEENGEQTHLIGLMDLLNALEGSIPDPNNPNDHSKN
jgi:hypothetical protein